MASALDDIRSRLASKKVADPSGYEKEEAKKDVKRSVVSEAAKEASPKPDTSNEDFFTRTKGLAISTFERAIAPTPGKLPSSALSDIQKRLKEKSTGVTIPDSTIKIPQEHAETLANYEAVQNEKLTKSQIGLDLNKRAETILGAKEKIESGMATPGKALALASTIGMSDQLSKNVDKITSSLSKAYKGSTFETVVEKLGI